MPTEVTAKLQISQEQIDAARKHSSEVLGKAFIGPGGPNKVTPRGMLTVGSQLRDKKIWDYPILPGAILVFQQLASMREWTVSGRPRAVARAVEWLNNAQTLDLATGMVYTGLQQFLQRRALDYLIVGRTAFAAKGTRSVQGPILEYIDPTELIFQRNLPLSGKRTITPVKPNETIWQYADNRTFRMDELVIDHPFPFGSRLFISPIVLLLPTATLAWLLREHDTAALDGRKIREILFVGDLAMQDALENAITIQAALWSGAKPEDVGIPVVTINNPGGQPVQDLIGRLGISQVPETFDREEFIFAYVNEIAATIGLALRHFWNNERTTNRALEIVQEQRQQQKGPSSFVRSEQRLINNSGFLERFDESGRQVRFAFIEETDTSSLKDKAEVLEKHANALEKIAAVFGGSISLESYVAWMQSQGVLPNELELIQANTNLVAENPDSQVNAGDETTASSDPEPTTLPGTHDAKAATTTVTTEIDYDEIVMNGNGVVIDRRRKVFRIEHAIKAELRQNAAAEADDLDEWIDEIEGSSDVDESEDAVMDEFVELGSQENRAAFKRLYTSGEDAMTDWVEAQNRFPRSQIDAAIDKCLAQVALDEDEQAVIDTLVSDLKDRHARPG